MSWRQPCDNSVEEDSNLLFDGDTIWWSNANVMQGLDKSEEGLPIDPKLSADLSWVPRKQFLNPLFTRECRCVVWSMIDRHQQLDNSLAGGKNDSG